MKYFITTILSALFLFGVAACGDDETTTAPTNAVGDAVKVDHDASSSDSEDTSDNGDVDATDTASAAEVSVEDSDSSE